jgi:hypothetical protein
MRERKKLVAKIEHADDCSRQSNRAGQGAQRGGGGDIEWEEERERTHENKEAGVC